MHKRKAKTIRNMPPLTRQIAKTLNDLQIAIDRIDKRLPDIQNSELDSQAFWNRNASGIDVSSFHPHNSENRARYVT